MKLYNVKVGGFSVGMTTKKQEAIQWLQRGPKVLIPGGKEFAEAGNSRFLNRVMITTDIIPPQQ